MTAHRRHASHPVSPFSRLVRSTAWLLLSALLSSVLAQTFNSSLYYQQCLRFEALGDLETARQSCLNALELNAASVDTKLALARVELRLGDVAAAAARLNDIRDQTSSAEPYVLLAEAALAEARLDAAAGFLNVARNRLEGANSELKGRFYFLEGELAASRGDYGAAQRAYRSASTAELLNPRYPLALASLLFKLGDAAGAGNVLETYRQLAGNSRDPVLLSLLGRIKWAQSDLSGAVSDLNLAVEVRRDAENTSAKAADFFALALVYYGQGNFRDGSFALQDALRRGALLSDALNRSLLWLILLVALLALHLLGESRIVKPAPTASPDLDAPATWTLLQVYAVLGVALAFSLGIAFVYGAVRYENYLAFLTPLQSSDTRSLFFACLGALLFAFTVLRTLRNGLDPVATLLGSTDHVALGAVVGFGLVAVTFLYLAYLPGFGSFYLNFSRLTPILVAAAVLVPLSEVFFRSFALPSLQARYPYPYGVLISGTLFALVFASPLPLLLVMGLVLAELFRRTGSGFAPLVASLVFHLSLVVGVALSPWVRQLFV